jgi:hypothetical protein
MNNKESKVQIMNELEQRIAIAKACGYYKDIVDNGGSKGPYEAWFKNGLGHHMRLDTQLPDYLNDLNAMHSAEKLLNDSQKVTYFHNLASGHVDSGEPTENYFNYCHSTAAQRAEAFLRCINQWKS